jgi:hypothetical protein
MQINFARVARAEVSLSMKHVFFVCAAVKDFYFLIFFDQGELKACRMDGISRNVIEMRRNV